MGEKIDKQFKQFCDLLKEMSGAEFLGIVKLLGVDILKDNEQKEVRQAEEMLVDVLGKFQTLNRRQKRNLMKLMRGTASANPTKKQTSTQTAAKSCGTSMTDSEVIDGSSTENN